MEINRLLRALSPSDKALLAPGLVRVELRSGTVLETMGEASPYAFFPECGLAAVIAHSPHRQVGVGVVGSDGMTALEIVHNAGQAAYETIVQADGTALRIASDRLRSAIENSISLRHVLLRYAYFFMIQASQTALTNSQALMEERLGRWILMCHDRMQGDVLNVTHEFISIMLGVRRAGITGAMHVLEGNHLIKSRRNHIEVLDRKGLIALTAGAYGFCEGEYERLIDPTLREAAFRVPAGEPAGRSQEMPLNRQLSPGGSR